MAEVKLQDLTEEEIDDLANYADYQMEHWQEILDSHAPDTRSYRSALELASFYKRIALKLGVKYADDNE